MSLVFYHISPSVCFHLLQHFREMEPVLPFLEPTILFSSRKCLWGTLPDDLMEELQQEMKTNKEKEEKEENLQVQFNVQSVRMYKTWFGNTKPHCDVVRKEGEDWTFYLFITETFMGGRLFLRPSPPSFSSSPSFSLFDNPLVFTIEPEIGKGVWFPKHWEHWTNDLLGGEKIFLMMDGTRNQMESSSPST